MSRAILITGATGKQSSALIKSLYAKHADFQILAVTRDTTSASAQKMVSQFPKITLIQGDFGDTDAMFKAAKAVTKQNQVWGVFSVQPPGFGKKGAIQEQQHGTALIDSALKNGVSHFVYASVDRHGAKSSETPTDVPHFASKHNIENHLINKARDTMSWTILRPVTFMDNFDGGFAGKIFATTWERVVKSRPLQLIATEDIGVFAAMAFMNCNEFKNKSISLAGDELTYEQMVQTFARATGSGPPATWGFLSDSIMWLSKEMETMFTFFERTGCDADIEKLREIHPDLKNLETWLRERKSSS